VTDTNCWGVIAIKGPGQRKARLAGVLGSAERDRLAVEMFRHVLGVTAALLGPGRTVVVSPSALHLPVGTEALQDDGRCLNAAFDLGRRRAFASGADQVLLLPADLPALQRTDLEAMLGAGRGVRVVLAPSRSGEGTNGLLLDSVARAFPLAFGPGSFHAHRRAALSSGMNWELVRRAGLEADVDHPADLEDPSLGPLLAATGA